MAIKDDIFQYVKKQFHIIPDYPWIKYSEYAVLRHPDNRKWFGLIMRIPAQRIGIPGDKDVDIINLKCEPELMGALLASDGYCRAYHMSKSNWITVLLDGTVNIDEIISLVKISYNLTADKKKRK